MSKTARSDHKTPKRTIYLDYAATTPTDLAVLKKMLPFFGEKYGNPSSMYTSGRRAGQEIAQVRQKVADIIGASSPTEIIFTGSGTESDNLAIKGIAHAHVKHGKHIIISSIEHKAVMESAKQLEKEGYSVSIAPVDPKGVIDIAACLRLIRPETTLISVMYANNEIGTIEPIRELAVAIKAWRADHDNTPYPFFHTDACQAAGALSINVHDLGVDLMSLNGSKIYGPKGVGALYKRSGIDIEPQISGGEQEANLRAGTESVALIVGFGEALALADKNRDKESLRLCELRDYFIERLLKKMPKAILNGPRIMRLPNNIHISIPDVEGESILLMLDEKGIEVSTGSACSAHDLRPSHVLRAIGQDVDLMHGSIRFSLGKATIKSDLDYVLSVFPDVVERLAEISALTVETSKSIGILSS